MIARCISKCWVIKLTKKRRGEDDDLNEWSSSSPNIQRGIKGNIIVYPQRPEGLLDLLPRPIDELTSPICAVFVGPSPPSKDWIRNKAKPLAVNGSRVKAALLWLKASNPLYSNVQINHSVLDTIPEEYVLPVDMQICKMDEELEALTSRYDNIDVDFPDFRPSDNRDIVYDSVVISDVNCNATSQELHAAALSHLKRYERPYVELPHGYRPENEFYNPELLPNIYPTLFPYGVGGFEHSRRSTPLSFSRQVK
ncbi:hypothetical protein FA13DRAFT_1863981, partial [Coprinellus micaceus]